MANRRFILPIRWKRPARKKGTGRHDRVESRRFASRVSLGMILAGGIIGLVVVANRWMAKETLHGVRVIGAVVMDTAEVLKQAAIPDSVRVQRLNLKEIEERVADHPFVAKAAAYYGGDGQLVLEIDERSPVAVTVISRGPVYLDAGAVILPFRFGVAAPDVPVLSGLADGDRLDSAKGVEAIGVAESLRQYNELLYRRISEIHRGASGEYTLILADGGVPVIAGKPEEIPPRLPKLEAFLNRVLASEGPARARLIDLRWDGQVVVRWKGEHVDA